MKQRGLFSLPNQYVIKYNEFASSVMHDIVIDAYFTHASIIESVEVIKADNSTTILNGQLYRLHSASNALEFANINGNYIQLFDVDCPVSIHLLQRQLLFHILNINNVLKMKIVINLHDKWIKLLYVNFMDLSTPEHYNQLRYNILNMELPLIRDRIVSRVIDISETDKVYQIPIKNDVSIMLCYNAFNNNALTSHHESTSLLHTAYTKSIHLQKKDNGCQILVQSFDDSFRNPIPFRAADNKNIESMFRAIISILRNNESYLLPMNAEYIDMAGSVVNHKW